MRIFTVTMISGALAFAASLLPSSNAQAESARESRASVADDARLRISHDVRVDRSGDVDQSFCDSLDLNACESVGDVLRCEGQLVSHADYQACLEIADGELGEAASAATAGGSGCAACSVTPEGLASGGGAAGLAAVAVGLVLVSARRRKENETK